MYIRRNILISTAALSLFGSQALFAQSNSNSESSKTVKTSQAEEKPSRRKKAEMCGECGKPETECECHGHKEDKSGEKKEKE